MNTRVPKTAPFAEDSLQHYNSDINIIAPDSAKPQLFDFVPHLDRALQPKIEWEHIQMSVGCWYNRNSLLICEAASTHWTQLARIDTLIK